ncbi:hypothetical protein OGAPHI_007331 [Ogataea philodendri]|uniref:Mitochondrial 15S rRNA processing factor CCM1 n=1 Tax=Ogataea philodendri TaxID=1378263 RepID=A0A9P8T013_9ASCO|nr:uncharacterized protein OGAPHI_007331 [Ogataea philodendri]KAH3660126.1 hypothetical protein OGAPHI_007331 [Ogataea philodendri]
MLNQVNRSSNFFATQLFCRVPRRWQTSQAATADTAPRRSYDPVNTYAEAKARGLKPMSSLSVLTRDTTVSISDLFAGLEEAVSGIDKDMYSAVLGRGHLLFSKLHALNKDNASVPDSLLFSKLLTILQSSGFLHWSHVERVIRQLLAEKKYDKALELWNSTLDQFGSNISFYLPSSKKIDFEPEIGFRAAGLAAYLLKSLDTNTTPEPAVVKRLVGDKKLQKRHVNFVIQSLNLSTDSKAKIADLFEEHVFRPDPNSVQLLKSAHSLAVAQKYDSMESLLKRIFVAKEKSQVQFTQKSYAMLMEIYNVSSKYEKTLALWGELVKSGTKPEIDSWNQFLNAHVSSDAPQKLLRIESVYKLLTQSVQPNSTTYNIMINGYLSSKELNKGLDFYKAHKSNVSESELQTLKNTLLAALAKYDYIEQTDSLFNVFTAEAASKNTVFEPNVQVYNIVLQRLLKKSDFKKAIELGDQIAASNTIVPDSALFSSLFETLTHKADETGISAPLLIQELVSSKVKKINNSATITDLVRELANNPATISVAENLMQQLREQKTRLPPQVYNSMVIYESAQGRADKAIQYFYQGLEAGSRLQTWFYNNIFKALSMTGDTDGIRDFYDFVKTNSKDKPNRVTFYYMLRAAQLKDDHIFAQWTIDELSEANLANLGDQVPRILERYSKSGLSVPSTLKLSANIHST